MTGEIDRKTGDAGRIIEIERRVLGFLCVSEAGAPGRRGVRGLLTKYRWSDAAHQTVFDIIMSFPSASPEALREQLPSRLTRRGFPDFDFDALFAVPASSPAEAEKWTRELAGNG